MIAADQACPFSEAGLSGRRCRTGARDGLHFLRCLLVVFAEEEITPSDPRAQSSRLLGATARARSRSARVCSSSARELRRLVLRCRHSAAGLSSSGVAWATASRLRRPHFSLGDVLVRDDEDPIACVDLLNLRSDGRGSFCLCRRLCLSGLRRGSLVLEIRMGHFTAQTPRPIAARPRRPRSPSAEHWPLLAGRRRVGSTRLTIRRAEDVVTGSPFRLGNRRALPAVSASDRW